MSHSHFAETLIAWYKINKRDLPWRKTKDPYAIWISEIILQQTRVDQGKAYYLSFLEKFPTVKHLALAKEQSVLKIWEGLGYYSRARNLHAASKQLLNERNGNLPQNYDDWLSIKGVGPYTAAAITSFAFNERRAVVDGNVFRVLSRYFGVEEPIDSGKGKKVFQSLAEQQLHPRYPGIFNQAIMEFGALQCTPKNPSCATCVLAETCLGNRTNRVKFLPIKSKKIRIRQRYFHYLILSNGKETVIRNRTEKDVWKGLFEFPLIETEHESALDELSAIPEFMQYLKRGKSLITSHSKYIKHVLSHQHLFVMFIHLNNVKDLEIKGYERVKFKNIRSYAFPRVITKYLESNEGLFL